MTIVQLFGTPVEDTVIPCHPMPGVRFYIAYVVGIGHCPHQHRLEEKAQGCRDRMRNYVEGRRPRRRPW